MKNLSLSAMTGHAPTGSGIIYAPYIPIYRTDPIIDWRTKLGRLPRQRKTFTKWLEGQAFSDLMDTGEKDIQIVLDLHARHGAPYAWLAFCALAFIAKNGYDHACLEARKLYIEVITLNTHTALNGMTSEQELDMIAYLTHACQGLERFNITARAPSRFHMRQRNWPIRPKPYGNEDMLQLAHFLIIFTSDKVKDNELEGSYGTICVRALRDIIRVYNEHIRPNVL